MRGGARPGAGRKRSDAKRVVLSCRVKPETLAAIQERAAEEHKKTGTLLDDIFKQ